MTQDGFLSLVWRRRWIVLLSALVCAVVAGAYSVSQPKEYETSTTFLIAQPGDEQAFDAVQAAQVAARTYGDVVTSPNIAARVSTRLGGEPSGDDLESAVEAEPVPETSLLRLTVTDQEPVQAKRIADAYASEFLAYVRRQLTPVTQVSITVADPAPVPDTAVRPRPTFTTILGLLLGLVLGLALAYVRERFDRRVLNVEALEELVQLPILARVPVRGRGDARESAFVEAFRLLRINLTFGTAGADPARSIAVVSYLPGEGKSTTVTQLATVSAATSGRVLVVEADVLRPAQQRALRPDAPEPLAPGLTNAIVGEVPVRNCVHPTRLPNVRLVPAGPRVPSLSSLVTSPRGQEVLAEIAATADLALLDCPPLSIGADAATLASQADATILVVDMEQVTSDGVREALRRLEAVQANVLGVVVNRDQATTDSYEPYGYGSAAPARPALRA